MKNKTDGSCRWSMRDVIALASSVVVISLFLGCTAAVDPPGVAAKPPNDDQFAAETYDEYTEPLTNAVIGTPSGVRVIGAASERGSTFADRPLALGLSDSDDPVADGSGFWRFDDCSPTWRFLLDSSGEGAHAHHELGAACAPGIVGQGVHVRTQKDVVQVHDQPQFTASSRIALAAWVNPNSVAGHHPIIIKRLQNQTAFSLGIHEGNIEMSVVLTTGTTIISRAPIAAGTWTHVAGMFDGTFVFLFINGQQFGQVWGAGTVRNAFVPLRIGATTQTQFFDGIVDDVFVSTKNISKEELSGLSCVRRPTTMAVNPIASTPVPFDTAFHYEIAVTNNDVGSCQPVNYDTSINFFQPGIDIRFDDPGPSQFAPPGGTVTFGLDVKGSDEAPVGVHDITFSMLRFDPTFEQLGGHFTFELVAPSCFVHRRQELMITSTSVVDDPVRTTFTAPGPNPESVGVWTFGHLMREIARSPEDATALTQQLFETWLTDQTVNGFVTAARPAMQQVVLDGWPRTPAGALDLERAPFVLQAIVNRIDLRDIAAGSAGQGRLVFAHNNSFFSFAFTVIVEYNLPAQTPEDVLEWANLWHGLSSQPFPSEAYNQALEAVTRRFTARNAGPGGASTLVSLRTNENVLSPFGQWELRQFELSPESGFLRPTTVAETPHGSFNGTQTFANFVNQNAAGIIALLPGRAASVAVPHEFQGAPFLAGSIFNDLTFWSAGGITNLEARFHASLNTCNGCHGPETNTQFLHIFPRQPGNEAGLSGFMTGTPVFDPFSGERRTLNDLKRRKDDLTSLVCPPAAKAR